MQLSIDRQTHIIAGLIAFTGFFGGYFVNPNFYFLDAMVAFGLSLNGWMGICPMSIMLKHAPWNKNNPACKDNKCC